MFLACAKISWHFVFDFADLIIPVRQDQVIEFIRDLADVYG